MVDQAPVVKGKLMVHCECNNIFCFFCKGNNCACEWKQKAQETQSSLGLITILHQFFQEKYPEQLRKLEELKQKTIANKDISFWTEVVNSMYEELTQNLDYFTPLQESLADSQE